MKNTSYIKISLLLIALDQASKLFLIDYLSALPGEQLEISFFFKLIHIWNYGISFGLFGHYQYSNVTLILCNSLIVLYLMYYTCSIKGKFNKLAITIIISGAIGNLIDRLLHGAVFDFLYFHCSKYSFPAFNLADSYITIGVIIYLVCNLLYKK